MSMDCGRDARGPKAALVLTAALLTASSAGAVEMISEPVAHLQGLDKTTARVSRFDAPVGQTVRFGTLSILVRVCKRNPPEEPPENAAFLEIFENRPGEAKEKLFSGWMFSSSPALSALEHPVYDVNLLACTGAPPSSAPPAAPPASPPAPPAPGKKTGNSAR
jgi:hypothetical protein